MFQTLLAFFGYVKVPKEAIQMCIYLEDEFKTLATVLGKENPTLKPHFEERYKVMHTLTQFLRTGRLFQ